MVVSSSSSSYATNKQRGKFRWMLPILSGTVLILVIVQQNTIINPFRTNVRKSSTTSNSRSGATPIPAAATAVAITSSEVLGAPVDDNDDDDHGNNETDDDDDKVVFGESSMIAKEKKTTTTTSSNNHLIIHVGPPKTGTSSIQCQLQVNPFLNSSNCVYLGHWQQRSCLRSLLKQKKHGVLYHKMRQVVHYELIKMRNGVQSQALGKSLEELYARNYHAVLSSEAF